MRARTLYDLIVARRPRGFFSVRIVEDECGPAVHCMFERKEDADRLASTVRAIEVVRYDGYASQRIFRFGDEAANSVYWALACLRGTSLRPAGQSAPTVAVNDAD